MLVSQAWVSVDVFYNYGFCFSFVQFRIFYQNFTHSISGYNFVVFTPLFFFGLNSFCVCMFFVGMLHVFIVGVEDSRSLQKRYNLSSTLCYIAFCSCVQVFFCFVGVFSCICVCLAHFCCLTFSFYANLTKLSSKRSRRCLFCSFMRIYVPFFVCLTTRLQRSLLKKIFWDFC